MQWFDYKQEIGRLISGTLGTPGQGRWVVLRMSRIGQYSQYWDDLHQEATDGPKYDYDDFIVRAIVIPAGAFASRPGVGTSFAKIYEAGREDTSFSAYGIDCRTLEEYPQWRAIHGMRTPNQLDSVYEIGERAGVRRPRPPLTALSRIAITDSEAITGDYGKTEFIIVVGRRDHSKS